MKNKWEQWQLQKGSLCCKKEVLKKLTSSEVPLQKLFTRSWRHQRFWRSSRAEDHQKLKDWRLQMLFKWYCNHTYFCRRLEHEATANSKESESIGCYSFENLERTIVRSVQPLSPLLWFVSASTRTLVVPTLVFFHTWNGFEIDPS